AVASSNSSGGPRGIRLRKSSLQTKVKPKLGRQWMCARQHRKCVKLVAKMSALNPVTTEAHHTRTNLPNVKPAADAARRCVSDLYNHRTSAIRKIVIGKSATRRLLI